MGNAATQAKTSAGAARRPALEELERAGAPRAKAVTPAPGRALAPGDTVEWDGSSGDVMVGVLVGFAGNAKAPVVRRWSRSQGKFGRPQQVAAVRPSQQDLFRRVEPGGGR